MLYNFISIENVQTRSGRIVKTPKKFIGKKCIDCAVEELSNVDISKESEINLQVDVSFWCIFWIINLSYDCLINFTFIVGIPDF